MLPSAEWFQRVAKLPKLSLVTMITVTEKNPHTRNKGNGSITLLLCTWLSSHAVENQGPWVEGDLPWLTPLRSPGACLKHNTNLILKDKERKLQVLHESSSRDDTVNSQQDADVVNQIEIRETCFNGDDAGFIMSNHPRMYCSDTLCDSCDVLNAADASTTMPN